VVEYLELLYVTDELVKLWDVKVEVHKEYDAEVVEKRGIDSGHCQKVLQILVNTYENKFGESGEGKAHRRRQRSAFRIGARFQYFRHKSTSTIRKS